MQKPRTRDIEQQIAQLRWRRQQNERLIRSSLEASKTLKQKDTILGLTVDQSSERELWTNSIVMDELSRPLVITDEQLHNIQYEEHKIQKRLWKVICSQLHHFFVPCKIGRCCNLSADSFFGDCEVILPNSTSLILKRLQSLLLLLLLLALILIILYRLSFCSIRSSNWTTLMTCTRNCRRGSAVRSRASRFSGSSWRICAQFVRSWCRTCRK